MIKLFGRPPEIVIETPRFILRSIAYRDFAARTLHWTRDPEFSRYYLPPGAASWTLKRWRRLLRSHHRKDRHSFGIWPKAGGGPIGVHKIDHSARTSTITLAVGIGERDWWGKGVVVEVRAALIQHYLDAGVRRVWGVVRASNYASIYNYQRLGFTHEGTLRASAPATAETGQREDELIFGLLPDEWRPPVLPSNAGTAAS